MKKKTQSSKAMLECVRTFYDEGGDKLKGYFLFAWDKDGKMWAGIRNDSKNIPHTLIPGMIQNALQMMQSRSEAKDLLMDAGFIDETDESL